MDMDVAALRERLRLRDQVVELLKRDLAARDEANEGELSRLEDIGEGLRRSIADGEARIAALARELETRPTDLTVASLEARVRTLQALVDSRDLGEEGVPGGADVDADMEGRGAHLGGGVPTTSSDADPLNAALRRNRRLADELAAAKRDAENAYAKLDASANEATEAQKAVEERDATIKQMEQHLIAATASTAVSSASSPGTQTSTPGAAGLNADLLPVVIGQRDRYKRKVGELEHRVGALEVDLDGERFGPNASTPTTSHSLKKFDTSRRTTPSARRRPRRPAWNSAGVTSPAVWTSAGASGGGGRRGTGAAST
jgi:phage shock protein A